MYDLLLKGGTVVDPSQGYHQVADVAVLERKIVRIQENICEESAERVVSVDGKIITPGLVDLHTHVFWGNAGGVIADEVARNTGVTTFVDAGSAGPATILGFKEHIVDPSEVSIYAFLNLAWPGLSAAVYRQQKDMVLLGELNDLRYGMVGAAVEAGRAFSELVVGIKVRVGVDASGTNGVTPVYLAIDAAESLGKPVMVHLSSPPPTRKEVLNLLRKGDILTHAFRGDPNSPLDRGGNVLREMEEARERGVVFDIGHGGGSFSWDVCEAMLDKGFPPDTISSDIHLDFDIITSWPGVPLFNQLSTMSKFLSMGMDIDEVILRSAYLPAQLLGKQNEIGTLEVGTRADISVLNMTEGKYIYTDKYCSRRIGKKALTCEAIVLGGHLKPSDLGSSADINSRYNAYCARPRKHKKGDH